MSIDIKLDPFGLDSPAIEDEPNPLSLTEIYNTVLAHDELIITIPADQEQALRTGLAGVKAKQNAKLKASGLTPDTSVLSFVVTPHATVQEAIDIHILLSKKNAITVLAMRIPDDTI